MNEHEKYRNELWLYYEKKIASVGSNICQCKKDCELSARKRTRLCYYPTKAFVGKFYGKRGLKRILFVGINPVNREGEFPISMEKGIREGDFLNKLYWKNACEYARTIIDLQTHLNEQIVEHIAVANSVKCWTKYDSKSNKSCLPTDEMWNNCLHHLIEEFNILKPNTVITFGNDTCYNLDKDRAVSFLGEWERTGKYSYRYYKSKIGEIHLVCLRHPSYPWHHEENRERIQRFLSKG